VLQCVLERKNFDTTLLHLSSVVNVIGRCLKRKKEQVNRKEPYGGFELHLEKLELLNKGLHAIFELNAMVNEEVRLRYRYLDLRSETMLRNLKFKSEAKYYITEFLRENAFVDVELPTLSIPTPEGARNFLVKSSSFPDAYFSLLQSPQVYKQLLMLTPLERYFSFARCYRDETLRANRQPEFTQLDLEMSYIDSVEPLIELAECLVRRVIENLFEGEKELNFYRITYDDAVKKYGSDKPNQFLFDKTKSLSSCFEKSSSTLLRGKAIAILALELTESANKRKTQEKIERFALERLSLNVATFSLNSDGRLMGSLSKRIDTEEHRALEKNLDKNKILLLSATDSEMESRANLMRLYMLMCNEIAEINDENLSDNKNFDFFFVTEIPMFSKMSDGTLKANHHPFTMPVRNSTVESWSSKSFDLVCNGEELLSGSIRINDPELQREVLRRCGLSEREVEERYGFFIEALEHGAPPHGGFAMGLDRFVGSLLSLKSIRESIAFPKNTAGRDLLLGAPAKRELLEDWKLL
jgi:aspartyl-tRNA synthetase